ncbi:hypothetical protein FD755_025027, partial [Muntiacus reevesi]
MTENGSHQLIVKARFNFKQTNEDELSVCKGDIIYVTRVEEGGWWEGTLNGRTGWFPSNYVREIKSSELFVLVYVKKTSTELGGKKSVIRYFE